MDAIGVYLSMSILILIYTLLTMEILHKTIIALLGIAIVLALNVIFQIHELLHGVDLDTILLLISMMTMVCTLSKTSLLDYIA